MSIFGNLILPIGTKPVSGWVKWFHKGIPDEEGEEREGDYVLGKLNEHGQRITIDIKLKSPIRGDIILKSGWLIRPLGYITCNTPLGDR